MTQILIDGITNVTFAHGLVRVECVAAGPNNEQRPSGTLLIPAAQAAPVLKALANALQELQRKQQEHQEQQQAPRQCSRALRCCLRSYFWFNLRVADVTSAGKR